MVTSPLASTSLPSLSPLVTNLFDPPPSSPGDVIFEQPPGVMTIIIKGREDGLFQKCDEVHTTDHLRVHCTVVFLLLILQMERYLSTATIHRENIDTVRLTSITKPTIRHNASPNNHQSEISQKSSSNNVRRKFRKKNMIRNF